MTAAVGAAGLGARVLLAEADRTGGECLWTGCVPSKSLIAAARRAHEMRTADRVGLAPVEPAIDLARVMDRVRDVIATIEPHDAPERLRRDGVEVVAAPARFVRPGSIDAGGRHVRYRAALIATGSAPALPPVDGLEAAGPLTSDTLWELRELPAVTRPLAVAALLGFVVSWSQYATSLAVGGGRLTLPVVLLPFIARDPQLTAVLSLVFLLPPLLALTAVHRLWRR